MNANYSSGILGVAYITIGVDHDMADHIGDCVSRMSWAVSRADCEGYISAAKRPPFSQQVKSAHACIAIINFDIDPEQAFSAAAYIHSIYPNKAAIVAMSTSQDADFVLRAMRAGCTEFIGEELDEVSFSATLSRLYQNWSSTNTRTFTRGQVLSFFGAKGGVGTTTLAVHLAMYLAQVHQKKTLLIDNHPQLGHVCVYLGLDGSRYHFQELVRNLSRLDSDLLRGYIATHSSGLEVLSSPDTCDGKRDVDPESIAQTIDFLRGEYDYVIIDSATPVDDTSPTIIENSNQVYLVAAPEIGVIRDLSRYVDKLSLGDHTADKLHVLINRYSSQHAVNIEQIEKAIRLPVAIKLPNAYSELVKASILGEPISPKQKTEFSMPILKWSNTLVGASPLVESDAPAPKKSVFALWK